MIFLVCFYRGCRLGRRVVAFCSPGALRKLDLINFLCLCIIIVWRQNKPTLLISGDLCLLHVIGKYIKDIYIITAWLKFVLSYEVSYVCANRNVCNLFFQLFKQAFENIFFLFFLQTLFSAGVGRSGTFIVIDAMLSRIQNEETIDIYNYVRYLRTRRMHMVQTEVNIQLTVSTNNHHYQLKPSNNHRYPLKPSLCVVSITMSCQIDPLKFSVDIWIFYNYFRVVVSVLGAICVLSRCFTRVNIVR